LKHEPQKGSVAELASRMRLTQALPGLAPITFLIGAGCSVTAGVPAVSSIAKSEVTKLAKRLTGRTVKDPAKALIAVAEKGYL
jgi:hypothetical protein